MRRIAAPRYAVRMAEPARTTVASPAASARQWRLCLLLTQSACRLPWEVVLERAIAGGVDAVQVREKNLDARELVHAAAPPLNSPSSS